MARTFEELTGEGLDTLYQGALFLTGGSRDDAESLLVDALTLAYRESRGTESPSAVRWLEARLVRTFLSGETGQSPSAAPSRGRVPLDASILEGIGPNAIFAAAAVLPSWPRAALWLVLVQRWSYAAAAEALDITPERLLDLLRYRDALITALMRAPLRRGITNPSSRTG